MRKHRMPIRIWWALKTRTWSRRVSKTWQAIAAWFVPPVSSTRVVRSTKPPKWTQKARQVECSWLRGIFLERRSSMRSTLVSSWLSAWLVFLQGWRTKTSTCLSRTQYKYCTHLSYNWTQAFQVKIITQRAKLRVSSKSRGSQGRVKEVLMVVQLLDSLRISCFLPQMLKQFLQLKHTWRGRAAISVRKE